MSEQSDSAKTEFAYLAGGCFWCIEAVFAELRGVRSVQSGYMGGSFPNPSYELICTGMTGHAEVVRVEFDPAVISFDDLLDVFFAVHDPTTLNRQGADVGTQYRSEIFAASPDQKAAAQRKIAELTAAGEFSDPIVTAVSDAPTFYPAEDYHDDYFANNPGAGYCQFVIAPKVAKFRKAFGERLKSAETAGA